MTRKLRPSTKLTHAKLQYSETGVPVSEQFDDIYFTKLDGLAESRYVFLQHSGLPERWQSTAPLFCIAETGFGSGLNFLSCWQLWLASPSPKPRLHFISFEKHPLAPADLQRAHAHFPELAEFAAQLQAHYPPLESGCHRRVFANGQITLDLWFGDINEQLPECFPGCSNNELPYVDAWFLDGFAPDKNPAMWQDKLFLAIFNSTRAGGTFATFTAAGDIRRRLTATGFQVRKAKGFRFKREMLHGQRPVRPKTSPTEPTKESITTPHLIIGGGIAAATLAHALQRRGQSVRVLTTGIADGASGNPQAAVYPLLQAQRSPTVDFYIAAYSYAQSFYRLALESKAHFAGVLHVAHNQDRAQRFQKIAAGMFSEALVAGLATNGSTGTATHPEELQAFAHVPGLYYPSAGWIDAAAAVRELFATTSVETSLEAITSAITQVDAIPEGWQLTTANGETVVAASVTLAAGAGNEALLEQFHIALQPVRGQITEIAANENTAAIQQVLCYKGYLTPQKDGKHCLGATFHRDDATSVTTAADDEENIRLLQEQLPQLKLGEANAPIQIVGQRSSVRSTSRDHLPIVGQLAPGLTVIGALGSRGFTAAPLCAEILAAELCYEPVPLAPAIRQRLEPLRLQGNPGAKSTDDA